MKVRVKEGKVGFIYGILRREGQEFELEDSEKFSKVWMEALEEPEQKKPESNPMKVKELKAALEEKGVDIPEDALKPDLIKLLEESE